MTYDELVTNIRNYTEVNSNVFTNAVINTFITMAENRILRDIDLDYFKKESTASMTSGSKPWPLQQANSRSACVITAVSGTPTTRCVRTGAGSWFALTTTSPKSPSFIPLSFEAMRSRLKILALIG